MEMAEDNFMLTTFYTSWKEYQDYPILPPKT
jgi:hypothetical protein